MSDESVFVHSKRANRLLHLTLTRAQIPVGQRKLPTKPLSEFHALKPDFVPRSYEEADLEDMRDDAQEEQEEAPAPKKFMPPRGGMSMPLFDPAAIKSTLKKAAVKPPPPESQEGNEETKDTEESPRKPLPFGAKGFALPGMGMGMSMGDLGAVKLKKSAAAQPKPAEPAPAEQVDFRSMLKKPAKK